MMNMPIYNIYCSDITILNCVTIIRQKYFLCKCFIKMLGILTLATRKTLNFPLNEARITNALSELKFQLI